MCSLHRVVELGHLWYFNKSLSGKDSPFSSFCNKGMQNYPFSLTCEKNVSRRVLPVITAKCLIQLPHPMVKSV